MVSVTEFHSDYELFEVEVEQDQELEFLQATNAQDDLFSLDMECFDILTKMEPKQTLFPTLHESVFEEPVKHAVWSGIWPDSNKHFPN